MYLRFGWLIEHLGLGRVQPRHLYARSGVERTIHIWWGGLQRNGDLMPLLAYLLTRNPGWRNTRVKVMSVASNETAAEEGEEEAYAARLEQLAGDLPPVFFVRNASLLVGDLLQPADEEATERQLAPLSAQEERVALAGNPS
jgi:hypothetical protein